MATVSYIWIVPPLLAAQDAQTVFESMRQGFSGPTFGPMALAFSLAVVVMFGVAAILSYVRHRREMQRRLNSPAALFKELAFAHALRPDQRKLLSDLAKAARSSRPDRIFIWADLFDQASGHARFSRPEVQERIGELRRILFALSPTTSEDLPMADKLGPAVSVAPSSASV